VIHKPSRLLSYSEIAAHFATADAILAVHYQPHGAKPLIQRYRRVLEDRSDLQLELRLGMLSVAFIAVLAGEIDNLLGTAVGAKHLAVRPPKTR
jgi:hypothetical protein